MAGVQLLYVPVGALDVAAFAPDGGQVLAADRAMRTTSLVDLSSGVALARTHHHGQADAVAFAADAGVAAVYADGVVHVLRRDRCEWSTFQAPGGLGLAVSPDGTRIATADHHIVVLDTSTGACVMEFGWQPYRDVPVLAFSPDGGRLAIGSSDGSVQIVDSSSGEALHRPVRIDCRNERRCAVWRLAWSPPGNRLAVGNLGGRVYVIDALSGSKLWHREVRADGAIAWSANGRRVALGGGDGRVAILDSRTGAALARAKAPSGICALGFPTDSVGLLVATEYDGVIRRRLARVPASDR